MTQSSTISRDRSRQGTAATIESASGPVGSRAPVTVALVNDYEIIVRGLHAMLARHADRVAVVEYEVAGTPDRRADVALFDTFAGRRGALERAGSMVAEGRCSHVVLYTWDATSDFLAIARELGVSGVILKSSTGEELVDLLERVVSGERIGLGRAARGHRRADGDGELSLREREVLALVALGRTNPEIARELFLSVDTVKTYVRRLFAKLGVNNRTQAALLAAGHHVAPPEHVAPIASGERRLG